MSPQCPIKGEPCLIANCEGKACNFRGWCWKHYTAWRRHGDPLADKRRPAPVSADGSGRLCNACGQVLPWSEFYPDTQHSGTRGKCKRCIQANARQRYADDNTGWQQAKRKYRLAQQFGITVEQYDAMLAAQGGVCALCGDRDATRRLAVDHDHQMGAVRSLLCGPCNLALGQVETLGREWLWRALRYLDEHSAQSEASA